MNSLWTTSIVGECLECKDQVSEISAVEICIQVMHWGLVYILLGIKPQTFEELATDS